MHPAIPDGHGCFPPLCFYLSASLAVGEHEVTFGSSGRVEHSEHFSTASKLFFSIRGQWPDGKDAVDCATGPLDVYFTSFSPSLSLSVPPLLTHSLTRWRAGKRCVCSRREDNWAASRSPVVTLPQCRLPFKGDKWNRFLPEYKSAFPRPLPGRKKGWINLISEPCGGSPFPATHTCACGRHESCCMKENYLDVSSPLRNLVVK